MQYYTTNIRSCHTDLQALQNVIALYQPNMNKHALLKAAKGSDYFTDTTRTKIEKTVHNMFFKWFMNFDSKFNHYLPADLLKDIYSYDMADKQKLITQLQTIFAVLGERIIYDFVVDYQRFNDYLMDDNDLCHFLKIKTDAQFLEWSETRIKNVSKAMSRVLKGLNIINVDEEFNDSFTMNHDNLNLKPHDQLVLLLSFLLIKNQYNKSQFFNHPVWVILKLTDNDVNRILSKYSAIITINHNNSDYLKIKFNSDDKHQTLSRIMTI